MHDPHVSIASPLPERPSWSDDVLDPSLEPGTAAAPN